MIPRNTFDPLLCYPTAARAVHYLMSGDVKTVVSISKRFQVPACIHPSFGEMCFKNYISQNCHTAQEFMRTSRDKKIIPETVPHKRWWTDWRGLTIIIMIGAAVRLTHITWGLPNVFEEATPLNVAMKFWNPETRAFDFNPHFFNYPALTFYLNFLLQGAHYLVASLLGNTRDIMAFTHSYETDPASFVLLSRLLSVLFDLGTIVMVFLLGNEIGNSRSGVVAALFIATNYFLLRQAQQITVDTPLTLFCAASLFFIVRYSKRLTLQRIILAGVFIGLSASVKYTGALLMVPLAFACVYPAQEGIRPSLRQAMLHLVVAGLTAVVVFIVCNPFIILSFNEFITDFRFEETHMEYGHLGLDSSQTSFGYYLLQTLPTAGGWIFLIILLFSLVVIIPRMYRKLLPILSFSLVYLVIISFWRMHAERYILPLLPPFILLCAIGLTASPGNLIENRFRFLQGKFSKVLFAMIIALIVLEQAVAILPYQRMIAEPDTRELAIQWIRKNLPRGSVIATIPFGLENLGSSFRTLTIPFDPYRPEDVAAFYDHRLYLDADIIVGTTYDLGRYCTDSTRYRPYLAYYDSIRSSSRLVYSIQPDAYQNGPTIWLFHPQARSGELLNTELLASLVSRVPEKERVTRFFKGLFNALVSKRLVNKAIQVGRHVVMLEPQKPNAHRQLAAMLYNANQYEESLRELDIAQRLQPDDNETAALRGDILFRLGLDTEAMQALRSALASGSDMSFVYFDLARLYARHGNRDAAINLLTEYLHTVPPRSNEARNAAAELQDISGKGK